ncbi:hypothetical protein JZ751_013421 [Albula glossodonta]|uniref:Sorting nexin 13 n=1 Tax=Albula glossodonta TaxID=121402 RepID=A0A8T2MZI1_9TELE|nr:hypothetical protein JZ751_013421 [Albula glossodonta]
MRVTSASTALKMTAEGAVTVWGWGVLGVLLLLLAFGPCVVFYLPIYLCCFTGGGCAVMLLFGKTSSEKHLERCEQSFLPTTQTGILKVIQFALRDYIQYWYYTLSNDDSFLLEIRQTVQNALVQLSTRSKEVDWQPYFTTRLVDDFATHLRVFRKAQDRLNEREDPKQRDDPDELLDAFFEAEVEIEKRICRDVVCTSAREEESFLRDLCEVLLYLLLPPGDFHNKNMRYFVREVLARGVLQPLISQLSDPDYINQLVIWMNQINSLLFVKKVCETRIQRLHSGKEVDALKLAANFGKLCVIPLEHILVHNIALHFFMDHMQQMGGQADLFFWLTVEGYRVTAQQQLQVLQGWQQDGRQQGSQTKGLLRAAALGVYEQYLSPKVYDVMLKDERFYPSFLQIPFLPPLPSLPEGLSLPSSLCLVADACLRPPMAGVCNDHGKTYALYAITVFRRNADGSEDSWKTYRRYSDFHDFHMRITEQFEGLGTILKLPGKKTFNNMDRDFLEKRKKDLNTYLQLLLNPETVRSCPSLTPYVNDFLENKAYSKGKGDFARKMDTFVNPLRSSMRNVSNAVKSLPDSLAEGMTKVSDNMGRMSERLGQDIKQSIFKMPPLIPKPDMFDLKERNQWLRRNIKNLLQQLIRATYGDTINRKIVDHVDFMTAPEQVADYVKRFRGTLRVFEMFQHQQLNRRLVYVLLEGLLETMFPQCQMPQLFTRLHSRSPRLGPACHSPHTPRYAHKSCEGAATALREQAVREQV